MQGDSVIFWMLAGFFLATSVFIGMLKLIGAEQVRDNFERYGYSTRLRVMVGALEILGSAALIFEMTRFYGAGLLACVFIGAIYTHARNKQSFRDFVPVISVFTFLLIVIAVDIFMRFG